MNGTQVYIVIHTETEEDDFRNPCVDMKVFDSEKKAKSYLKKYFDLTLKGLKKGDTVLDVVSATNCGCNAEIELGERDEDRLFGEDNSTIEVVHNWRICHETVNK